MHMENLDHSFTWCLKKRAKEVTGENFQEKRFKHKKERAAATSVNKEKEKYDKTALTDKKMSEIETEYLLDRQPFSANQIRV